MALTEKKRPGAHVVEEVSVDLSRETYTVAAGADLVPGTVLGKVTASGKLVQLAPAAVDGSEVAHSVLYREAKAASADVTDALVSEKLTVFNDSLLTWPDGISAGQKTTAIGQLESKLNKVR